MFCSFCVLAHLANFSSRLKLREFIKHWWLYRILRYTNIIIFCMKQSWKDFLLPESFSTFSTFLTLKMLSLARFRKTLVIFSHSLLSKRNRSVNIVRTTLFGTFYDFIKRLSFALNTPSMIISPSPPRSDPSYYVLNTTCLFCSLLFLSL